MAFGELMQCNIKLEALRTGVELTPWAQANFLRKQLATMLRSRVRNKHSIFFFFLFFFLYIIIIACLVSFSLCFCFCQMQEAKQINILFAGFDKSSGEHAGPQLYFMDYLASMAKVPYAAQGYGGFFTLSILDRHYKPDLSLDEAKDLLKQCIAEVLDKCRE